MKMPYLPVDRLAREPLHAQIAEQLLRSIRARHWEKGDALPTVRALARHLHVSLETVQRAYHQLQEDGWIESRPRIGTVIIADVRHSPLPLPRMPAQKHALFANELRRFAHMPGIIPVSGGSGSLHKKVLHVLQEAAPFALERATKRESMEPFGLPELRSHIQGWLTDTGIFAPVAQICVVSGTQQAIAIVAAVTIRPGASVFVPDICYQSALEVFRDRGAKIRTFPVRADGMHFTALEQTLSDRTETVALVYLTTNGHHPTGWSLSDGQKLRLYELAKRHRFAILEDDYYGGFYHFERPPQSIWSLGDGQADVYYVRTFSNVLHPSMRLGFLLCPQQAVGQVERTKYLADTESSPILQHLLLHLWDNGAFSDTLLGMREIARIGREMAVASCLRHLPRICSFVSPEVGLCMWVQTPTPLGLPFFQRCLQEQVMAMPDEAFSFAVTCPGFQTHFGATNPELLDEGLRRVGRVLREHYGLL